MKRIDAFHRVYPLFGVVLAIVLVLSPILFALVQSLDAYSTLIQDSTLLLGIAYSVVNSLACTIASLVLGLPGAYVISRRRFPLRGLFRWLLLMAMAMPQVIFSISTESLLGRFLPELSWLRDDIALVLFNIPVMSVIIGESFRRLDARYVQSAMSLGIGRGKAFRTAALPLLRPAIIWACALSFIRCFTDLAIRPTGMGGMILHSGPTMAAALAIVSTAVSLISLLVLCTSGSRKDRNAAAQKEFTRKPNGGASVFFSIIYMLIVAIALWGPAIFFLYNTFEPSALMALFGSLEAEGTMAFIHSASYALAAGLVGTFIGIRLCSININLGISLWPYFLPLASGPCVVALGYGIFASWFGFESTLVATMLSHLALSIPVSILVILPVYRKIPRSLSSTSMSLGYSLGRSFRRIDRKMLGSAVAASVLVIFAVSLGDFGISAFTGGISVSAAIMAMAAAGNMGEASVLSAVLLALYLLVFSIGAILIGRGDKNV